MTVSCPDQRTRPRRTAATGELSGIVRPDLHGPDRGIQQRQTMDRDDQQTLAGIDRPDLRAARACVVVIHGEGFGQRIDIGGEPVVIGRASDADLRIANPGVSRRHCEIRRVDDAYVIRDLDSTNGTRIGEATITRAALADGDHITVGQSILKFIADANVEAIYHERVARLIFRDQLTGLLGRQEFIDAAEERIRGSLASAVPLSLALIDVECDEPGPGDDGPGILDGVLTRAAMSISQKLADADLAARIGERRFAVVLAGRGAEAAEALVAHLQRDFAAGGTVAGPGQVEVRIRGGTAQLQPDSASLGQMVKRIQDTLAG